MDKNMKYVVLALAGGLGVYLIWKGGYLAQWFPELFGPSTGGGGDAAAKAAAAATATKQAQAAAAAARVDPTNPQKVADAKRLADEAAAKVAEAARAAAAVKTCTQELRLCPDGSPMPRAADCTWLPAKCPPKPAAPPATPQNYKPSDLVNCGAGQVATWTDGTVGMRTSADSAVCHDLESVAPVTPPAGSRMDQIQNLALAAGEGALLNMDQWCYYAGQIGVVCPDPGDIDPALYAGAWGEGTDRTTPIAVDTFWYLATVTDPSLAGLRGLAEIGMAGIGWLT